MHILGSILTSQKDAVLKARFEGQKLTDSSVDGYINLIYPGSVEIVGKTYISEYQVEYQQARKPLAKWVKTIENLDSCTNFVQLKQVFGANVDYDDPFCIFDITNNFRLVALIVFILQRVSVERIMTHDEYDRRTWKATLLRQRGFKIK